MWCMYHGRRSFMAIDKSTGRVCFIRRRRWLEMSARELERFTW